MGLSQSDKKPVCISLEKAYSKIRKWYKANIDMVRSRNDDYGDRSVMLIEALPEANMLTDLEIRAVLGEVIYGRLEWAYHQDDGDFKMAAYSHAALDKAGISWNLSDEDKEQLKNSTLWLMFWFNRK
jgi:hypothetical protein